MRYVTGGLIVFILAIAAVSLKPEPALAGCPGYSSSAATISPCVGPPNSIVIVTMRRTNVVPQAVSFHTGVNNGIAVGGIAPVTRSAAGYTFVVPAALCSAGSGSQFAVKLSDANNHDQGEIGRFMIDCRSGISAQGISGSANSFADGDFSAAANPGTFATFAKGSRAIPGWIVMRATIDLIGTSYWAAPGGGRSIDLDGTPGFGAIAQTFATVRGATYTVTFLLSGNNGTGPAIKRLRVTAGGHQADFTFNLATGSAQQGTWVSKRWSFVAISSTTTLQFASMDTTGGECGPVVARIAVARH
jgi:choice-of-anchor C domain-containing protein